MPALRRTPAGRPRDAGAAAVEFVLVLPLLLLLLLGTIEFGRAWSWKIALTQAAREGARVAALQLTSTTPDARVTDAARPAIPAPTAITTAVTNACPALPDPTTPPVSVTASATFTFLPAFGAVSAGQGGTAFGTLALSSTAVMRCGG